MGLFSKTDDNSPNLLDAIEAIKKAAKPFAALVALDAACDKLAAAASHEAELETRISALQVELGTVQAALADAQKAHAVAKATAQAEHKAWLGEYDEKRTQVRAATDAEVKAAAAAVKKAHDDVAAAQAAHAAYIKDLQLASAKEEQRLDVQHAEKLAALTADQAAVIEATRQLKDQLATLKAKLSPLMQ